MGLVVYGDSMLHGLPMPSATVRKMTYEEQGSGLPRRRLADAQPKECPVNLGDMLGRNFVLTSVGEKPVDLLL
jgi:hypothetical protein